MSNYYPTYAYKSVLGLDFFQTEQAAKLADLTKAVCALNGHDPSDIVSQLRRRQGPAFEVVKVLAELIDDRDTLADDLRAEDDAKTAAWWAKHQAEEAAKAAAETPVETVTQGAE